MTYKKITGSIGAIVLLALISAPALAHSDGDDDGEERNSSQAVRTELRGFQEVPVISTTGRGSFRARIGNNESTIEFALSYENLEGNVAAAHIHLAQKGVNGGIVIHLCGTGGKPACPGTTAGELSGVLTSTDVVEAFIPGSTPPATQGVAAGELNEVIKAIRAGKTYVNVHSSKFPGGECRGQVR